ncbi:MAG: AsmA family protein [Pseudomonadota bacterium]
MRILGYTLLTLICLLIGAVTFLVVAAPVDLVRSQLVAAVERSTGRTLEIRGETSLSFFPVLGVSVEDVVLSAPPGMNASGPFAEIAQVTVAMPVRALLQQRVDVEQFILDRPVIRLETDRAGRTSYDFSSPAKAESTTDQTSGGDLPSELQDFARNSSGSTQSSSDLRGLLQRVTLGDVRINQGTVIYSAASAGGAAPKLERIDDLSVVIQMSALDAPLEIDGSARVRNGAVPFYLRVASLGALIDGLATTAELKTGVPGTTVAFDGKVTVPPTDTGAWNVDGALDITAAETSRTMAWAQPDSADQNTSSALGKASARGTLKASAKRIKLEAATFALADQSARGSLGVTLGGKRPMVEGVLAFGTLDPTRLLGGKPTAASGAEASASETASDGQWSDAPIDVSSLTAVDARVAITAEKIRYEKYDLGPSRLRASLAAGRLQIDAAPVSLFGGSATAQIVVIPNGSSSAGLAFALAGKAENISALPILKAAADFDYLSGAMQTQVDLRSRGRSMRALMQGLQGTARFAFADGAVEGYNVAKILRGVQQGQFSDFDRVEGAKTDFSALSGSARITQGVAQNEDLSLIGPLVRASGRGKVDIGRKQLDYRLSPQLVATLEGQGGGAASGFGVPISIKGPWSSPAIAPDLDGLLNDPTAAAKTIEGAVRNVRSAIKSKKVGDLVESVLGGGQNAGQNGTKQPGNRDAENGLGGLLGDFLKQQ